MTPISLGTARQAVLVPDAGSDISTDEFGIDSGTIRHSLGDQKYAQGKRPRRGDPYIGALPQFRGFFADTSGIIGGEGLSCYVDILYRALNPGWGVPPPERTHELELKQFDLALSAFVSIQPQVPIPHPVLLYKFSAPHPTDSLGKYSASPPNAPDVRRYEFPINVPVGTSFAAGSVTLGNIQPYVLTFTAAPAGWLCLQDDATPMCGGAFFAITQRWKREYLWTGIRVGNGLTA